MLQSIDWWITSACNFRCGYCYGPNPTSRDSLQIRDVVIQRIIESSVRNVTLCGGEPLLVNDLDKYLAPLKPDKTIVLNTNASLLQSHPRTDTIVEPTDIFGISIDGHDADTQRSMRGPAADLEVAKTVALELKRRGKRLKVATVATSLNCKSIAQMLDLILHLAPDVWRIYQFAPRSWRGQNHKYYLDDASFSHLVQSLQEKLRGRVPVAASTRENSRGCFIVDHRGNYLDIKDKSYLRVGHVSTMSIEDACLKLTNMGQVELNKRWLTLPAV